uniref:C2H2-type domain-containing protein n=1 Tax=Strix occidentalis caurina TaxID=311401 RepID=A0A8D0EQI0_STROC
MGWGKVFRSCGCFSHCPALSHWYIGGGGGVQIRLLFFLPSPMDHTHTHTPCPRLDPPRHLILFFISIPVGEGESERLGGAQGAFGIQSTTCPFGLPTGAGTDKQKEEQCQPREEQRGMLQGPKEEPQSPTVDVEHDGQQQPDDTQGSHRPRRPRKSSFKGTYAEDCQEASTDPWSSSREKKYKCEHCEKVFVCRSKLIYHLRTHTGEKPYKCWDCGRGFSMRGNLLSHQRTHTKEKPFPCPTCGKYFSFRSNLFVHQRIHKGEKPYKCQDCGKSFRLKAHLLSHQRTHTKEKPFLCTTCGKRFSWRSNLITHQRIHTGERRYPGSHCGKSFQVKTCLRTHQESIHNGEFSVEA